MLSATSFEKLSSDAAKSAAAVESVTQGIYGDAKLGKD